MAAVIFLQSCSTSQNGEVIQEGEWNSSPCCKDTISSITKLFCVGELAYFKKDYSSAEYLLKTSIETPILYDSSFHEGSQGYNYMLIKSKACDYLKKICFEERKYQDALYFHKLTKEVYITPEFPDYSGAFFNIFYSNADFYSKCFEALGQYDSALKYIISCSFDNSGLFDERILNCANNIYGKGYVKENCQKKLLIIFISRIIYFG